MAANTVLVVDPSPQTAQRVEEALADTGFSIARAANAAEVEPLLDAENITLVLSAVNFPRGNGYELARHVRERHPGAVVFLLCGGFEVYSPERAAEVGIAGRIGRPLTVEGLRRHLEGVLGPLGSELEDLPDDASVGLEPVEAPPPPPQPEPERVVPAAPARLAEPQPAVADERVASFVPRDFRTYPAIQVDPTQVGPAMERVILEVLPEVVETILTKALQTSPAFRDLVEAAVDEAVRVRIGAIARKVVRERLLELEAGADEG